MAEKIISGDKPFLPQGWQAMFAYRGDDGEVVLRTSPLKSWTLIKGSQERWQSYGVTEDGPTAGINNSHFCGYLRDGEYAERYKTVAEAHLRRLEEVGAPLWSTSEDHDYRNWD